MLFFFSTRFLCVSSVLMTFLVLIKIESFYTLSFMKAIIVWVGSCFSVCEMLYSTPWLLLQFLHKNLLLFWWFSFICGMEFLNWSSLILLSLFYSLNVLTKIEHREVFLVFSIWHSKCFQYLDSHNFPQIWRIFYDFIAYIFSIFSMYFSFLCAHNLYIGLFNCFSTILDYFVYDLFLLYIYHFLNVLIYLSCHHRDMLPSA